MACILIVDDRPTNRQFLTTLLGYAGHRLVEAADGAEALRVVRAERPDLVITDILMPTMDGFKFVQTLRRDPELASTAVIFYSATFSEEEAQAMGRSCGVRTTLPKPAEPQAILDAVQRELGLETVAGAPPPRRLDAARTEGFLLPSRLGDSIGSRLTDLQLARDLIQGNIEDLGESPGERIDASIRSLHAFSARLAELEDFRLRLVAERRPGPLLDLFAEFAQPIMAASAVVVCLLDPREAGVAHLAARGAEGGALRAAALDRARLPGALLHADTPVRLSVEGARSLGLPAFLVAHRAFLGLPVKSAAATHGWMFFLDPTGGGAFSEDDERIGLSLAAHLAVVYENAVLYETVQRHASQLQVAGTERERALEELKESEERFRQIAEGIKEVFWLTNPARAEVLYVSPAYEQIWGRPRTSLYEDPMEWMAAIHPDDRRRIREAAQTGQETGGYAEEYRIVRPDGSVRWIRDRASPIANDRGEIYRIAGLAEDVTEERWASNELRRMNRALKMLSACNEALIRATEEEALLHRICELVVGVGEYAAARVVFARDDEERSLEERARAGQAPEALRALRASWASDRPEGMGPGGRAVRTGEVVVVERLADEPALQSAAEAMSAAKLGSGVYLPLSEGARVFGLLVLNSAEGVVITPEELSLLRELAADLAFGICTIRARDQQRQAEEALRASLAEKEALLKEVHHRVKNNLQVISSLLRLEAARLRPDQTGNVLKDMQNRIHSMALLHETLYRSRSLARVDLAGYFRQLAESLVRSLPARRDQVALVLDLAPVELDLDQAIPCGLVVNELVTNALKHAFPGGRRGTIRIELVSTPEGLVSFSVRDDGPGLPEHLELKRPPSLGLQLVFDLARQLQGKVRMGPGPGASFEVTFKRVAAERLGTDS